MFSLIFILQALIPLDVGFQFSQFVCFFSFLFCFLIFNFFGCTALHVGSQFPDRGWNPCPLQWKGGVLTTGPSGKSNPGFLLWNYSHSTLCSWCWYGLVQVLPFREFHLSGKWTVSSDNKEKTGTFLQPYRKRKALPLALPTGGI